MPISHSSITYRQFRIGYDPPPIPVRDFDWYFVHEDYDGAPDSGDSRCGYAASKLAAMGEVDWFWSEAEYEDDLADAAFNLPGGPP